MPILPDIPFPATARNRIANVLFAGLLLFSWALLVLGTFVGAATAGGWKGMAGGLAAGWAVGFWIRRSLGLRGGNLTRGYFLHILARGRGAEPGWLENLVEIVRGLRLTPSQCRIIVGFQVEAERLWESAGSPAERDRVTAERNRKMLEAMQAVGHESFDSEANPAEPH
jgi:hypothetical protein